MSKTFTVALIAMTIRRDAMTITPVTVPPYEGTVLRKIFGKENVTGDEQVGTVEIDADIEHERLSAKYGHEVVADVYGDDEGERLAELVEKSAIKDKPLTKAQQAAADKAAKEAADAEAAAAGAGK